MLLLDTTREIEREEILDFCECNGIDAPTEGSDEEYKLINELRDIDYIQFNEDIECHFTHDGSIVITGTLGLWNGRKEIVPTIKPNLDAAIKACFGSCDEFKVEYNEEEKSISVRSYHHDGCNSFTLRAITSECADELEEEGYVAEEEFNASLLPIEFAD